MRALSILALAACALIGATLHAADADAAAAPIPQTQSDLSPAVLAALQQAAGTKEFSTISKSTTADGKTTYAAIFAKDGKKSVATVNADGTLVGITDAK